MRLILQPSARANSLTPPTGANQLDRMLTKRRRIRRLRGVQFGRLLGLRGVNKIRVTSMHWFCARSHLPNRLCVPVCSAPSGWFGSQQAVVKTASSTGERADTPVLPSPLAESKSASLASRNVARNPRVPRKPSKCAVFERFGVPHSPWRPRNSQHLLGYILVDR